MTMYDDILEELASQIDTIKKNIQEYRSADVLKDEFTISLDLMVHDITCYSENIKAGKDYDADIDFMR